MNILFKEMLKKHTTFKIGGIADVFVEPENTVELCSLIEFLRKEGVKYYILGNGSNILVSDSGVRGCVIHIGKFLSNIQINNNKIIAEAGTTMQLVSKFALENSLTGFENLSGIPGTIGGAVSMNAGAFETEMKDIVTAVEVIDENNKIKVLNKNELNFAYRKSIIQEKNYIVTRVMMQLSSGNKDTIKEKITQILNKRIATQPLEYPSAGSVFKRPKNAYASMLIQECELKGERIGDAEVSTKHCGFIINRGNATANDVYKLITKIRETVGTYYNLELETEIKLWGKFK